MALMLLPLHFLQLFPRACVLQSSPRYQQLQMPDIRLQLQLLLQQHQHLHQHWLLSMSFLLLPQLLLLRCNSISICISSGCSQ